MKTILVLLLALSLNACQASGTTNGRSGSGSLIANILTLEF